MSNRRMAQRSVGTSTGSLSEMDPHSRPVSRARRTTLTACMMKRRPKATAPLPHASLITTRHGLVPAIAIGRAEHVTVTNGRNGRPRRNGIERSFPERDPAPRGQAEVLGQEAVDGFK